MLSFCPADDARRALVSCTITVPLRPVVRHVIDKILASQAINRVRLLIKPADLVFEISKMTVSERPWEKDSDIVSKGMLLKRTGGVNIVCVRCGGQSETTIEKRLVTTGPGQPQPEYQQWRAWETLWSTRCVCGGAWARSM